jgi:MIP family channel proteins
MNARIYLAELLGTFLFMLIGYSSVAAIGVSGASTPGVLVVPFSFGFGLLAAIFAFGHISGGHYNPAVTVAIVLDKRLPVIDAVGYILAQVIGAVGAAAVVLLTVSQAAVTAGVTKPGQGVSDVSALILETVFTAIFVVVILTSTKRAHMLAPLAIPLTLVAIHFAIATLSGSSVNPARSIGSALVGGDLAGLWIYIVGPLVGGVIGWAVYRVANPDEEGAIPV